MNKLPRWRGFNLLEMFVWRDALDATLPGSAGDFREKDFEWIRGWGFDFVRIPMDYRFWTWRDEKKGTWIFRENALKRIDRVVALGQQYGLHVSLNFHHAPGYCVNRPKEQWKLWTDPAMQMMFASQWQSFAKRYKGISNDALSFDLVNEPPEAREMSAAGAIMGRRNHDRVIRAAVEAIRQADAQRLIIADGMGYGNEPLEGLADLGDKGVGQSCRGYMPFGVSHYQAQWVKVPGWVEPKWPGGDHFGVEVGVPELEAHYGRWAKLMEQGVGVHCGECGMFNKTPHEVGLRWMADVLKVLRSKEIGWALWNLRGGFGVLDSERADVAYEDFGGSKLDRVYLELLQSQ